jgi:DNA-binding transcriptional ArsR family regulator
MATKTDRDLVTVLSALADTTRLQVLESLSRGPRRSGELAASLGVAPSSISKHLRVLLEAGVVVDERPPDDARARVFRLRPDAMVTVRAWLDQLQAHWDEQLGAFKAHVERKAKR